MLGVDRTGCSSTACAGYTLRKSKLSATGVSFTERIALDEDSGTVSYNKCGAAAWPGVWSACSP